MKRTFILRNATARRSAIQAVEDAPDGYCVVVQEMTRSLEQNAAQWPYLEGFAQQKQAVINGQLQWVIADDWKDILTGAYAGEMRVAVFDGKVIMLPLRTSKMGRGAFSSWMDFLVAMADQCGVTPVYKSARRELETC